MVFLKKYGKLLILFGISYGIALFFLISTGIQTGGSREKFYNTPIENGYIENVLIILVIYPLSSIIGVFIGGYVFVPLFLFVHRKIIGRNLIYGIQELDKPTKLKKTFRGLFPSLMALNFALLLTTNEFFVRLVIYPEFYEYYIENFPYDVYMSALQPFLMFTLGFAFALFSPAWFLLDAGITYTNKKKVKDTDHPIEVHSMGNYFLSFLKGYASISVLITWYQFLAGYILFINSVGGYFYDLGISLITAPFLIIFISNLSIILLEITKKRRVKYVRKFARKYDITDTVDVSFALRNNYEIEK
ncbi:MAG: hypothetical protein ACFFCV_21235 [Promethearchaeota archaeon]